MSSLPRLQEDFRTAILGGDSRAVAAAVVGNTLAGARRVAIHRHHFVITLTEALGATYPVVRRLLGADYFDQLARRFMGLSPPAATCLFEYGADLAAFLDRLPALADFPYVPDVARLEWLINAAHHADDAPALDLATLATIAPAQWSTLVLPVHPATMLLRSAWPVDAIWQAHQTEAVAEVDISAGPVAMLVTRRADDVEWRRLDAGPAGLFDLLAGGIPLAPALEQAAAAGADPAAALTALLNAGAFAEPLALTRI